jgi:hypothetical protein
MLILLITLILNQVNTTDSFPKNGKYKYEKLGTEITVEQGIAVSAKIYDDLIPLTKKDDCFYGEIQKNNITTSLTVTTNDKKSLLTEVKEKIVVQKSTDNGVIYKFQNMGINLIVEDDLISAMYTGVGSEASKTELKINDLGQIASYSIYSRAPYTLRVENSKITEFWCEDCTYKIGSTGSSLTVSDNYYLTFDTNAIEIFSSDGVRKTIKTLNGTIVDVSVLFYENSDLLNSSTQFKIDSGNVIYTNSSKFITRKSL